MAQALNLPPMYRLRYTDYAWNELGYCNFKNEPREFEWSLSEILEYINDPEVHSDMWTPYDETDWADGLKWDNIYEPISLEREGIEV